MNKEIRMVDKKRGIMQVTIADSRWYMKQRENPVTKLPEFLAVPSVTWIAGQYPKGVGFYKWLADKGWDESQALKQAAGDKGSKVHEAISAILNGYEVKIDSKFLNKSTGQLEDLSLEEVDCIKSFMDWKATLETFEAIAWDITVFSEIHNYAGTIDLIAKINGQIYVIDFKTSQQVWSEYELQVSAYRMAVENGENPLFLKNENGTETNKTIDVSGLKTAVLQIGYRLNKAGWKWNEIEDKFKLFLAAKQIWENECSTQKPKVRDYPLVIATGKSQDSFEFGDDDEVVEVEAEIALPVKEKQDGTPKGSRSNSKTVSKTETSRA